MQRQYLPAFLTIYFDGNGVWIDKERIKNEKYIVIYPILLNLLRCYNRRSNIEVVIVLSSGYPATSIATDLNKHQMLLPL